MTRIHASARRSAAALTALALLMLATAAPFATVQAADPDPAAADASAARHTEAAPDMAAGSNAQAQADAQADAHADAETDMPASVAPALWRLAPFNASYRVSYEGVPFSLTGTRSLEARGDDWVLRSSMSALVIKVSQDTLISETADGQLQPDRYAYRQTGIGGKKTRILDFDRTAGKVLRSGDKQREQPLQDPAWDPLGWQLALRRDLSGGQHALGDRLVYRITDGGDYKEYDFEVVSMGRLTVPAGDYSTVLLQRHFEPGDARITRVWLAPDLDYLMVRLQLTDDDGKALNLALTSIEN